MHRPAETRETRSCGDAGPRPRTQRPTTVAVCAVCITCGDRGRPAKASGYAALASESRTYTRSRLARLCVCPQPRTILKPVRCARAARPPRPRCCRSTHTPPTGPLNRQQPEARDPAMRTHPGPSPTCAPATTSLTTETAPPASPSLQSSLQLSPNGSSGTVLLSVVRWWI